MRLEQMTVHLRERSAWEAVELGTALVRRHAAAIWKPWLLLTLPVFVVLNAAAWWIDSLWLAGLLMWWLKPAFDRIPLFVISRATFGATPTLGETLAAQLRWGWKPLLHYLTWRRLGPARSLFLPIDLLEGVQGTRPGSRPGQALRERRRVLGSAVYGNAALLTFVCINFEASLFFACIATILMFLPIDELPETMRAGWALVTEHMPWWVQLACNLFAWIATSVIEPFFVGAGFGLYLNRRTQIEAWDVEIAFRRLRTRLTAATTSFALVLALLGATIQFPAQAQEKQPPPEPATTSAEVFGDQLVDDRAFRKAVDQAYRDPLLNGKLKQTIWEKRDKTKPKEPKQGDLSWLSGIAAFFAFTAEWGLWIVVAILVLLLLLSMRYWLPWMRGSLRRHKPLPAEVETEALAIPEILPDDVPTEARRLWAQGKPRHALALLYRASVETMAQRAGVALVPGATESECLRASRRMPDGEDRSLFARMVRVWQYAAYAQQLPAAEEFDDLVSILQRRYRWAA
jgi:hypothetical protein